MENQNSNERFIPKCEAKKIKLKDCERAVTEWGLTDEEVVRILDFYLLHPPISKNDSKARFGQRSLAKFKWKESSQLLRLEESLLKASDIDDFCILKEDSISKKMKTMDLGTTDLKTEICTEHPRAIMKWNCYQKSKEKEGSNMRQKETRMECLFRHIRNSFAHNRTYLFENGNIMLEDGEKQQITARILMPKQALLDWIKIIKSILVICQELFRKDLRGVHLKKGILHLHLDFCTKNTGVIRKRYSVRRPIFRRCTVGF